MSVGEELQTAIYSALSAPLAADGFGLYDEVPDLPVGMPASDFPFVQIGDVTVSPFDNDDTVGHEIDVLFHIWSRYRGKKELHQGYDLIFDALNRVTFDLSSAWHLDTLPAGGFSQQRGGDNNSTLHGVGRFTFTIQRKT